MSTLSLAAWIDGGPLVDSVISEDFSKSRIEADAVLGESMITEDFKSAESGVATIITKVEGAYTVSQGDKKKTRTQTRKGSGVRYLSTFNILITQSYN